MLAHSSSDTFAYSEDVASVSLNQQDSAFTPISVADDIFESLQDLPLTAPQLSSTPIPTSSAARLATVELDEIAGVLAPTAVKGLADLTTPAAFTSLPTTVDPLSDLISRYFHRQERPVRNPALSNTLSGDDYDSIIPELMRSRTWHALAIYAEQQLTRSRPRDVESMFRLWYCRILALARLRMYSTAQAELDRLGDLDRVDFAYESQPLLFPGKRGSMVPFELRVIYAQLPACQGDPATSIDRIYDLIISCRKVPSFFL